MKDRLSEIERDGAEGRRPSRVTSASTKARLPVELRSALQRVERRSVRRPLILLALTGFTVVFVSAVTLAGRDAALIAILGSAILVMILALRAARIPVSEKPEHHRSDERERILDLEAERANHVILLGAALAVTASVGAASAMGVAASAGATLAARLNDLGIGGFAVVALTGLGVLRACAYAWVAPDPLPALDDERVVARIAGAPR